ncbi:uncharacterized protein DUF4340 [Archangium gephyra]|uniref:Uncharacterized protein DUF4340 n=1 Tax=Archangium gephyra TaxID=48 RepID=A0AAC8TFB5_9BACT|nr:DUF4340 domain-containing protein [Archangium gephyra]AKJ03917.1 Hypothetical protein AA314_05543 [Archangium gephyra]REG23692.1 uncharacterized protein DUF4340 [Archangium gephyra]
MKRGTLIALGAFAVLLVLVLATRERQVSVGVRKLELSKLDKSQVTALELTGARNATLRKEGEGWTVVDPGKPDTKYAADERLVTAVIEALGEVKNPDFVTDRAERLAEYELDDAKGLKLKVSQGGSPAVELVLGKGARNGGVYLRKAGGNDVFAHRGRLDWTVRKELKDWRRRQLVTLEAEKISQLILRSKEGESLTLKKSGTASGEWSLAEGTQAPAGFRFSSQAAEQFAQQLANLTAQDFLEGEAAADTATGLGEAHDSVEAQLEDGKKVVVHLGRQPEAKEGSATVAARVEGDAQVYQLPQYTAAQLRKRLVDFRDMGLLGFEPLKVTKLKVQAGGKTAVVVKEGASWKLTEPAKLPDGFEFDPSQVDTQLAWLRSLRGNRLIEGQVTDTQAGIASLAALVEVTVDGGAVQTLRLGKEAPGAANGGKELYARTTLDTLTYAVGEGVRNRLAQGPELFKRHPQPSFAGGGQLQGLESLPPDVRRQLEAQLRANTGHP